jgi:hypothetical protein
MKRKTPLRSLLHNSAFRSALRFAVTIAVTDALLLQVFGSVPATLLGSFAVAIHLYFLDFDGGFRERLIGHGIATLVGAGTVALGVLCATQLWLAVVSALVVSGIFAYLRLLRGYVARSAVGLQGAFFLPLMIPAQPHDLGPLLAGWLVGSGVSLTSALVLLPHRRSGLIRAGVATWLRAGAELARDFAAGKDPQPSIDRLEEARMALLTQVTGTFTRPGAVSGRERAVASMLAAARWSSPLIHDFTLPATGALSTLATVSATAYEDAANLVSGSSVEGALPDVAHARALDLERLTSATPEDVRAHYPVRLISISAMNQLYRATQSRGRQAPEPDVGGMPDELPRRILQRNFTWRSLWFLNALRTAVGTAACVLIVRLVGLEHGVWVVIAALTVTQVSLSGEAGARSMVKIVGGALGGILIAGGLVALHLPFVAYCVGLPLMAGMAKLAQSSSLLRAQLTYTPFVLINLAVLSWPPQHGVELVRIEDIALGALVAAGFSLIAFPRGIARALTRLQEVALDVAQRYLTSQLSAVRRLPQSAPAPSRERCLSALNAFDTAVDAAFMSSRCETAALAAHEDASARARDLLIGGDACAELHALASAHPQFDRVARELAQWWDDFHSRARTP